jgi:F0F1-type ATP synthase assembly protein I
MITPIIACIIIGALLDEKAGTAPWLLIVFILLGVGAAFRNLFYMAGKENKKGKKDE